MGDGLNVDRLGTVGAGVVDWGITTVVVVAVGIDPRMPLNNKWSDSCG